MADLRIKWDPPLNTSVVDSIAIYRYNGLTSDCSVILDQGTLISDTISPSDTQYDDLNTPEFGMVTYGVFSKNATGLSACSVAQITLEPTSLSKPTNIYSVFLDSSMAPTNISTADADFTVGPTSINAARQISPRYLVDGGYYVYPLFVSEDESNYVDSENGGSGASHTMVYNQTTFYMPNTGGTHNGNQAPTNLSISGVDFNVVYFDSGVEVPRLDETDEGPLNITALVDMDEDGVYSDVDLDDSDPAVGETSGAPLSNESPTNLSTLVDMDEDGHYSDVDLDDSDSSVGIAPASNQAPTNLSAAEDTSVPFTAPVSSFRTGTGYNQTSIASASYVGTDGKLYTMDGSSGWDTIKDDSNSDLTGITGFVGQYRVIDGDGKIYGPDPQFHPTNSRSGFNELSYLQGFEFLEGNYNGLLWGANGDGKLYANPIMNHTYKRGGTGETITNTNHPVYVESDFVPSRPLVTADGVVGGVVQYSEIDNVVWAKYTGNSFSSLGQIALVTSDGKGYYENIEVVDNQVARTYMVPIYENATTEMTGIAQFSIGDVTSPKNLVILKTDGSVWCQGRNILGQTGQGIATGNTDYPAQVIDTSDNYVTGVTKVISSINTNFALKDDGTVLFWGWNRYLIGGTGGAVGNNAPYKATLMQDASGNTLTGVVDITDEFDYGTFYFKKSDGTLWATGTYSQEWESDTNVFNNTTGRAYQIVHVAPAANQAPTNLSTLVDPVSNQAPTYLSASISNSGCLYSVGDVVKWYGVDATITSIVSSTSPCTYTIDLTSGTFDESDLGTDINGNPV